jgi:RNA polymerase sigma-70 factor, ECF subfamily
MDDMNVLTDKTAIAFGPDDRRFVYGVARRIVRSDEDADDVAQDALLIAHRNLASFRGDSHLRTWLYRIATTTALGYLRRARRVKDHVPMADLPLVDPRGTAEATLAEAELGALMQEAIATLSPRYRDVLLARADSTESEVAASLGISISNVKIRAHRARKYLREALTRAVEPACAGATS